MTQIELMAILPHIGLTALVLIQMIAISIKRSHLGILVITIVGLLVNAVLLNMSLDGLPQAVTALLYVDNFSALFIALFIFIAIVTCLFSYRYLHGRRGDLEEFYLLVVVAVLGASTMVTAVHFASMLLGLEILSIALYTLIAYPEEHHAPLEAALKYLILSGVASTTAIFGMALIYLATGDLTFTGIGEAIANPTGRGLYLVAGNAMLLVGLIFKLSLIPFHMWTPDVYEGAPAPVTGLVATLSKAAVVAVLLRYFVLTGVLSNNAIFDFIAVLAGASMVIGNLLALAQNNIKRLLAYSSIAHIGYLLIGLLALYKTASAEIAIESSIVYVVGYVLMTLAAFGVITILTDQSSGDEAVAVEDYRGLFWRHPLLATVLTITFLALAGIPLTIGFVAKFYVLSAGIEGQLWVMLWALIIGSSIGIYYYLRVVYSMTERPESNVELDESGQAASGGNTPALYTAVVLGLLILVLGIFPTPLIELVQNALIIGG